MHAIVVSHAAIKAANRVVYRRMASFGCDVTLVIPDRWKSGLGDLRAEPEPADSPLDMRVHKRRGISHSNVYWLAGSLGDLIRTGRQPAAIYVDEDPAGLMAAQAAWVAHARRAGLVVLAIQNLVKKYPPPFELLQRYVFRHAAAAVSISEAAAEVLRIRGYDGPTTAMGFGTDVKPLAEAERNELRRRLHLGSPLAGYVGRLVSEKGVDIFIEALARLPGVSGVIAGGGPEREQLEARAVACGVADRIVFTGVLAPDDAARIIGSLDVLVLPSRTRPNWAEQFGRVLIEAMASDVPVVAADSGAIGEVVGDAGILAREDDPAAFADGIAAALEPERNRVMRAAGLKRARDRFTNDTVARALYAALQQAANTGGTVPS